MKIQKDYLFVNMAADKISYGTKWTLMNEIHLNDAQALQAGEWINEERKKSEIKRVAGSAGGSVR